MLNLKLIQGDCLEVLPTLKEESIDCVVTSPPYFNIGHKYQRKGGFHYTMDFGEVLYLIEDASKEIFRIMKKDGSYFLNFGFSYGETGVLRPLRLAARLLKIGFVCQDIIIWKKKNPIPIKNRLTNVYEYIFLFSKRPQWHYKKKINYELNVWEFPVIMQNQFKGYKIDEHGAMFPEELPKRCILLASNEGDIILDPFLGTGTTMKVAKNLGRSCIGIEINPKYCEIAKKRCFEQQKLGNPIKCEFEVFTKEKNG